MMNILAFDIGGTKIKYGIVTEYGKVLKKNSIDTDISSEENFLDSIVNIIERESDIREIEGVAISMPGFIDTERGIPTVCYAINCIEGKSITDLIESRTGFRATVENDGNCAALAEKFNGNALNCTDFICVTVGTGIGGGIYLNDKIVRGSTFKGGEFGFMVCNGMIEVDGDDKSIMSKNASTRALVLDYMKYKGINKDQLVEGQKVFEDAKNDEELRKIIRAWYKRLAIGLANLSATLNPEKILIGGGVSAREEVIEGIISEIKNIEWWNDIETKIEACKHRNDAGLIGATYNFLLQRMNSMDF